MTTQTSPSFSQSDSYYSAGGNINNINVVYQGNVASATPEKSKLTDWLLDIASVNHYAIQSETHAKLAPYTASWILHEPKFNTWLNAQSGTFWGVGMPGAGKTVLTSFVVNYLLDRANFERTDETVIFVYPRFNDSLTLSKVLAALLGQLSDKSVPAYSYIYEKLYAPCIEKKIAPSEAELLKCIRGAIGEVPSKIFIAVDALDELADDIRENLATILVSLEKSIFMTSREITLNCLPTPNLELQAPSEYFFNFIDYQVRRLPKLWALLEHRNDVLEELIEDLTSKSDGMFLLAALHISALGGITNVKSLRKAVSALPSRLTDMYNQTLDRIMNQSEEEHNLACRAIIWVTHASRTLEVSELLDALIIEPNSTELDPDAITNKKTLVSVCCGLLTIEERMGTVQLIHYSAYEFFLSFSEGLFQNPHTLCFTACILYLQLSGFYEQDVSTYAELRQLREQNPFADYACKSIGYHALHSSGEETDESSQDPYDLLADNPCIPLSHILMSSFHFDDIHYGQMIHFAALHGILSVVRRNAQYFNTRSQNNCTPLYYACISGHASMVELLLHGKDAAVNTRNSYAETALHCASQRNHELVVRRLLECPGIDVNAQNKDGYTALHHASEQGHVPVVRLLICFPGIDLTARDTKANRYTALHHASENGREEVVQLLLIGPGIEINARDEDGCTALH